MLSVPPSDGARVLIVIVELARMEFSSALRHATGSVRLEIFAHKFDVYLDGKVWIEGGNYAGQTRASR
jgi:hypothetical protein